MKNNVQIEIVRWTDQQKLLVMIREKVFIEEQKVALQYEWDGFDEIAIHLIAYANDRAIGCARVFIENQKMKLGRMAVLKGNRRQGVGRALIEKAIMTAKLNHLVSIEISAQCHAIDFYKKFGFKIRGEIYLEAEITHQDMQLEF